MNGSPHFGLGHLRIAASDMASSILWSPSVLRSSSISAHVLGR